MALWRDDGLYIVESSFAFYYHEYGIQMYKYEEWIDQAFHAGVQVAWLPM